DGKFLAYNLMPQEGDGAFVVRNIASGAEYRLPRGRTATGTAAADGSAPPVAPAARPARGRPAQGGAAASPTAVGHQFTPDGKAVVVSLCPTKAELDNARQEKAKAEDMPRTALVTLDLATGKVTSRIDRASAFTVGGQGAGLLIYKRGAGPEEKP